MVVAWRLFNYYRRACHHRVEFIPGQHGVAFSHQWADTRPPVFFSSVQWKCKRLWWLPQLKSDEHHSVELAGHWQASSEVHGAPKSVGRSIHGGSIVSTRGRLRNTRLVITSTQSKEENNHQAAFLGCVQVSTKPPTWHISRLHPFLRRQNLCH